MHAPLARVCTGVQTARSGHRLTVHVLWLVLGLAVVALALIDAILTTLSTTTRAGWLTRFTTQVAWRLALAGHERRTSHGLLTGMGPLLLVGGLVQWLLLLWAGWTLVFAGNPESVVVAAGREPATALDRFYFAGASLFSLGTGDVVAATPTWRAVSVLATATGLFLVTLSLSYFISMVRAATDRRVLATRLRALGASPQAIVTNAWEGTAFSPHFGATLSALADPVVQLAEQHVTYHVLHYFHARHPDRSVVIGMARLDEALTLLESVDEQVQLDPFLTGQLRAHLARVIEVVGQVHLTYPAEAAPPAPRTSSLREAGIPFATGQDLERKLAGMADRRRGMAALVASDGWPWDAV